MSKAFDTAQRGFIVKRLETLGVKGSLLCAIRAMLRAADIRIASEHRELGPFWSTVGERQGGVLSPLLFNILLQCAVDEHHSRWTPAWQSSCLTRI